mmetsp:Transcript_34930/g.75606  ORF Transcript_34930/g.75606 Transcript_34930/m.75606 type:complete len:215 (-) Transcript_34930:1197-1841(-)
MYSASSRSNLILTVLCMHVRGATSPSSTGRMPLRYCTAGRSVFRPASTDSGPVERCTSPYKCKSYQKRTALNRPALEKWMSSACWLASSGGLSMSKCQTSIGWESGTKLSRLKGKPEAKQGIHRCRFMPLTSKPHASSAKTSPACTYTVADMGMTTGRSTVRSCRQCLTAGMRPEVRSPSSKMSQRSKLQTMGTSFFNTRSVGRLYTTFTWSSL